MRRILLLFLLLSLASLQAEITYSGGDGTSFEKAILIRGATEETGVRAEYAYLAKQYPGYKRGTQSLMQHNDRVFDVLEFTTPEGIKKTIYFDITGFFGKLQ